MRYINVILISSLLTACSSSEPTAFDTAKRFLACQQSQSQSKQCQQDKAIPRIIELLQTYRTDLAIGQKIINSQTKLVTTEQEFATKSLSSEERARLQADIVALKLRINDLRAAYLISKHWPA